MILHNVLNMVRAALYSIIIFGFGIFKFTIIFLGTTNCGMHYICCYEQKLFFNEFFNRILFVVADHFYNIKSLSKIENINSSNVIS